MQIVIDIPENLYKATINGLNAEEIWDLRVAIKKGTPLDSVKAEIAEEICLTDNPYTNETTYTIEHLKLLDILDNIGNAERSEKK